jgi:arabinose-5-phosphate isomerase
MKAPSTPTDLDFATGVLRAEAEAVANVVGQLDESFDRAVELLAGCKGTVLVGGIGKSGIIARKISATLASTGTPSHFLHPSEAMHGDLGRIRAEDVVVLLSYSGTTEDVLALAAVLRQDRVPIIAICSRAESHLGRLADACLCIGDVTEACPHNLAPTASTTAMLALGDALALSVSRRRDFSAADFLKRHPGGMLGRQLMRIIDAMRLRVGENLPLLAESQTVGELVETTSTGGRRVGATLLVDKSGRLAGILTDADIVKLIARHGAAALGQGVAQVMTRRPKTLPHTALVRDAVQMVREHRIDEIPIVDDAGRPLGVIDVQDLIALKVIEE